jgi:tRNA threonylcarbamoyl adenosine modification protein YjeE
VTSPRAHYHIVPPLASAGRIALTEPELRAWGEDFGRAADAPLVVAISGDVGAGKTTLVQAICRGAGVVEDVTSPTFALVHRYEGARFPVYHIDLYRTRSPDELTQMGWDEIVTEHALVLIEWPERAGARLPADAVPVALEHVDRDPGRRLLMAG